MNSGQSIIVNFRTVEKLRTDVGKNHNYVLVTSLLKVCTTRKYNNRKRKLSERKLRQYY